MEIFKDIKGYPNYQISNKGRVWNSKTQRYIKPSLKPNGYYQINLVAINGKRKKEYLHRLLALTFIPNPDQFPEVDHIDRNRGNNDLSNLRWVSRQQNCRNQQSNRPIKVFDKDGTFIAEYSSIAECADAINGSISGIYSYFRNGQSFYLKKYKMEV